MASMHNCKLTDKDGFYTFTCSRCRACYVCKHKAVFFDQEGVWKWKCKTGKFVEVILDGKIHSGSV